MVKGTRERSPPNQVDRKDKAVDSVTCRVEDEMTWDVDDTTRETRVARRKVSWEDIKGSEFLAYKNKAKDLKAEEENGKTGRQEDGRHWAEEKQQREEVHEKSPWYRLDAVFGEAISEELKFLEDQLKPVIWLTTFIFCEATG